MDNEDWSDNFLKVNVTTLVPTEELPNTPWVHLSDLESFLIGQSLIPLDDDDTFSHLSRWITECGFAGVTFVGRPVVAHTDDPTGPAQEIPTVYFRKERGCYGFSLSRVSMDQTDAEMTAAAKADEGGFGEPDWQEVIVNREQLLKYLVGRGWHAEKVSTGAPGRPSSMHLVKMEFNRRAKHGSINANLKTEGMYLEQWVRERFPGYPSLTVKTITNNLRGAHKAHFAQK